MKSHLGAALLLVLLGTGTGWGQPCDSSTWVVFGRGGVYDAQHFNIHRLDGCWQPADYGSFLATLRPDVPVIVYAHGNPTLLSTATRQLMTLRRQLQRQACGRPFVLVGWFWPATSEKVRIRLMRRFGAEAEWQAWRLGGFLQGIPGHVPVSLVGYSFGSRIVTGSLHLLAGGRLAGRCLPGASGGGRIPFRVTLLAPAMDNDWLLPGRRYGLAITQMESLLIAKNRGDSAMKWYPILCRTKGEKALGYTGPVGLGYLGIHRSKVAVIDLTGSVPEHDGVLYLSSRPVAARLRHYARLDWPALPVP